MNLENQVGSANKCQRHPRELVVGVCAACLRERLASVDPAARQTKGLSFLENAKSYNKKQGFQKKKQALQQPEETSVLGFLGPQLRRSKSFSEGRAQARAKIEPSFVEPKRRSCDIRVRNTLWALFQIDQSSKQMPRSEGQNEDEGSSAMKLNGWVKDEAEPEDSQKLEKTGDPEIEITGSASCSRARVLSENYESWESSGSAVRTMKYHIDQDTQNRNVEMNVNLDENKKHGLGDEAKDKAKTFWLTEMVMKRIQKWKKRNQSKRRKPYCPRPRSRAEMMFDDDGRPSMEDDPRFSIDIGRTSWEDSRHSWEDPRASWDGILIGKLFASSSVQENSAPPPAMGSLRSHALPELSRVPEKPKIKPEDTTKIASTVLDDENPRLSCMETQDKDAHLLENLYNQSDDQVAGSLKHSSKAHKWSKALSRSIANPMWGFIQKINGKEEVAYDIAGEGENGASESDYRRGIRKGEAFCSSNLGSTSMHCSSANSRSSFSNGSVINRSNSNSNAQRNKNGCHKNKEEAMLDRSRSVHISSSNGDNGLLRFYLTPLRNGSKRSNTATARVRPQLSSSRNALWLY
eukprot:TRINITY_DN3684_c0_g2_i1.p1 TRINITY_DN3684_c0_g2~~TRINITY_DN3684_c0_g2_i1.p1  ORF type:complete len:577 (+),score=131.91 TRINITY_DN3684_c0_g2_i1:428-2158(+)